MLHYNPRHVSSNTMLIFRRSNRIVTASVIVSYSVHRLRADCSPLSTGALNSCLRRETITDAVTIRFDLLKTSMVFFEIFEDYNVTYILL